MENRLIDKLKRLFGNKVRKLRKQKKLTQVQLAERLGCSVEFVGLLERGVNGPSFDTLDKLSQVLEVEVYELFLFEDEA